MDPQLERTRTLDGKAILRKTGLDLAADSKARHDFKNHMGIILGFSELLIADMADDDPRKPDVMEIRTAALSAMELLRLL